MFRKRNCFILSVSVTILLSYDSTLPIVRNWIRWMQCHLSESRWILLAGAHPKKACWNRKSSTFSTLYSVAVLLGGSGKSRKCVNFLTLFSVSVPFSGKVGSRFYLLSQLKFRTGEIENGTGTNYVSWRLFELRSIGKTFPRQEHRQVLIDFQLGLWLAAPELCLTADHVTNRSSRDFWLVKKRIVSSQQIVG